MAVTMQQVAELAGVSRGTVDRVMHGRPNVNPMVREKVLRAAALTYVAALAVSLVNLLRLLIIVAGNDRRRRR